MKACVLVEAFFAFLHIASSSSEVKEDQVDGKHFYRKGALTGNEVLNS